MRTIKSQLTIMFILLGMLAININLRAGYDPTIGRFLKRDPIDEKGFQLLHGIKGDGIRGSVEPYTFVKNNSVSNWDYLGLWALNRDSKFSYATACAQSGDKISGLAQLIGLSSSEWRKWLRDKNGKPISGNKLYIGRTYLVPNVVIAYWSGDMGKIGRWWINWNKNIDSLKSAGFRVQEYRYPSRFSYQQLLEYYSKKAILQGTYFWGHGNSTVLAGSRSGPVILRYSSLKLSYRPAFAHIYACSSNSGKSAFNSLIWTGFTGILYPLNPWDPDWDKPSK